MKIGGVTVDGLKHIVVNGMCWQKVLTRGLGGVKWKLCNVNYKPIRGKHYKNPVDMRRWIANFENENYEIWIKENSLNITKKPKLNRSVFSHGCVIFDGLHQVRNETKETEIPIRVAT